MGPYVGGEVVGSAKLAIAVGACKRFGARVLPGVTGQLVRPRKPLLTRRVLAFIRFLPSVGAVVRVEVRPGTGATRGKGSAGRLGSGARAAGKAVAVGGGGGSCGMWQMRISQPEQSKAGAGGGTANCSSGGVQ